MLEFGIVLFLWFLFNLAFTLGIIWTAKQKERWDRMSESEKTAYAKSLSTFWYESPVQEGETLTIRGMNGEEDKTYRVVSVKPRGSGKYEMELVPLLVPEGKE